MITALGIIALIYSIRTIWRNPGLAVLIVLVVACLI